MTGLDYDKLIANADSLAEEYRDAAPYPSIAIDNFLPAEMGEEILREFPAPADMLGADKFQNYEKRVAVNPEDSEFPKSLEHIFYELNSHKIINFLERLTGITGLVADPHFIGGGLIHTLAGGKLPLHVDFTHHRHTNLFRRVNLLIYFNKDWQGDWGGGIELWSAGGEECVKRFEPKFNRAVIFEISDKTWHGLPDPIRCPVDVTRKSINLYYYTAEENPDQEKEVFWTHHLKRVDSLQDRYLWTISKFFYAVIPPIIIHAIRKLRLSKIR